MKKAVAIITLFLVISLSLSVSALIIKKTASWEFGAITGMAVAAHRPPAPIPSIRPMMLRDILAINVTPYGVANLGIGVSQVDGQHNLGSYHQGTWYEQSTVGSRGPVWVEISWQRPETDVKLVDEEKKERKIYLPASNENGNLSYPEIYWIAEDGSSYFARADHGHGWPDLTYQQALVSKNLARKAGATTPVVTCKDSDGGKNYGVKGSVISEGVTITDDCCKDGGMGYIADCKTENTLEEFFCSNNNRYVEHYECPNGCNNGACLRTPPRVHDDELKAPIINSVWDGKTPSSSYGLGEQIKFYAKIKDSNGNPEPSATVNLYLTPSSGRTDSIAMTFNSTSKYYEAITGQIDASAEKGTWTYYVTASKAGLSSTSNKYQFTITGAGTCTDSDGGKDYFTKGLIITRAGDEQFYDACKTDYILQEGTCDEQGGAVYEYQCPNGCKEGACITVPEPPVVVPQVAEKVTCFFKTARGPRDIHKCYSSKGECSGTVSCSVAIAGSSKESVKWSSSCGTPAIATTTMDGKSEAVVFLC